MWPKRKQVGNLEYTKNKMYNLLTNQTLFFSGKRRKNTEYIFLPICPT